MSRFSIGVFVLIGGLGLVAAVQSVFDPVGVFAVLAPVAGVDFSALAAKDVETAAGLSFLGRWVGTQLVGVDGITLVLALTLFRKGHPWAVRVMWYWPLMFVSHAVLYRPGTPLFYGQFVWLALSVVALLLAERSVRRLAVIAA